MRWLVALVLLVGGTAQAADYWSPYHSPAPPTYSYGWTNPNTQSVSGYVRSNGTYVAPYVRTAPNWTPVDNFSYRGNYNPYTGRYGTR